MSLVEGGFGWNFVDGIDEAFATHGYCANDHWIVRLKESFAIQGDGIGTMHPNSKGHDLMGKKLVDKIVQDFYPGNDCSNPRRPQYLLADPGGPYMVLEGSSITLQNNSYTPFDDPLSYEWTLSADLLSKASLDNSNAKNPVLKGIDDATGSLSLRVQDSTSSNMNSTTVTVINVPPTVNPIQDDLVEHAGFFNKPVNFTGSFTDPGVLDTHTFLWEFGDGAAASGNLPANASKTLTSSHAYVYAGAEIAMYRIALTVTDDDAGTGRNELTVTIRTAQQAALELSSYINNLPDSCFSKKAENQRNTLIAKLQEVLLSINAKRYQDANNKLLYDIRVKADGIVPSEDWITDRDAQNKICAYIDAVVSYLKFLQGQA